MLIHVEKKKFASQSGKYLNNLKIGENSTGVPLFNMYFYMISKNFFL